MPSCWSQLSRLLFNFYRVNQVPQDSRSFNTVCGDLAIELVTNIFEVVTAPFYLTELGQWSQWCPYIQHNWPLPVCAIGRQQSPYPHALGNVYREGIIFFFKFLLLFQQIYRSSCRWRSPTKAFTKFFQESSPVCFSKVASGAWSRKFHMGRG